MSKCEKQINRAKEVAKALEEAKTEKPVKKKPSYAHVRALRRGNSTPTFASTPMKDMGEDEE